MLISVDGKNHYCSALDGAVIFKVDKRDSSATSITSDAVLVSNGYYEASVSSYNDTNSRSVFRSSGTYYVRKSWYVNRRGNHDGAVESYSNNAYPNSGIWENYWYSRSN